MSPTPLAGGDPVIGDPGCPRRPRPARVRSRAAPGRHPPARAPPARLRAGGLGEPQRPLELPLRRRRRRERPRDGRARDRPASRSTIQVPFPWGAPLSGVADEADVGWYARTVRVPPEWDGRRVFLCVGASDWRTTAWLDGQPLGTHQGGYTPFDLELTEHVRPGEDQTLVIRVDDSPHPFKLEGKQGYGPARGLWQTVYLEARPAAFVESFELRPDLSGEQVEVRVRLAEPAESGTSVALELGAGEQAVAPRGDGGSERRADGAVRGARRETAPVVPGGPPPLRGLGPPPDARGRGPRADLLRDAGDLHRAPPRAGAPVRGAQRKPGLPADGPRPGLAPRGLHHLAERRGR